MVIGRVGISNIKKTVGRGNGFPSLFAIRLYAFDTERLTRAAGISSLVIPSKESRVHSSQGGVERDTMLGLEGV
jgi:hypothetical protein